MSNACKNVVEHFFFIGSECKMHMALPFKIYSTALPVAAQVALEKRLTQPMKSTDQ